MSDAAIQRYLEQADSRFDAACDLLKTRVPEGQYNPWTIHCGLAPGSDAHHLRESMIYAVALLDSGREGVEDRALSIIKKVLTYQDRESTSERYGIWPMYAEEPLEVLSIPDWNYADFVGSQMVYVLGRHGARLAGGNETEFGDALRHAVTCAAWSIFRRNVQPVYTNIAISGAAVTARVAELINHGVLLEYSRSRLSSILARRAHHGGFAEYNAPGYTLAGMKWCEWISRLVEDGEVCDLAAQLHRALWSDYAEHFHPATGQLAGPHSRAYSLWIRPSLVSYIEEATGLSLQQSKRATELPSTTEYDFFGYLERVPCPDDIVERFRDAGEEKGEHRHTYIRGADEASSTIGTTWISGDASLGSVNNDCTFVQRHPMIAYWRDERDEAAMFRVRLLRDHRDFASGWIWTKQKDNRALSAFGLVTDRGDWHRHLDPPVPPGVFETRDFRIRYELVGNGARLNQLSERAWELCCPPYRIVLHTAVSRVGQLNVEWQGGGEAADDDEVHVDGVWYHGPSRVFDFNVLEDIRIACGLELLRDGVEPIDESISTMERATGEVDYGWGGLEVRAPSRPFAAG